MTASAAPATMVRSSSLRPLFVLTLLLGSFLLFLIQPMFARMILPLLGGAPAVWNTAMLFYQTALLAGYLYAHGVSRLPFKVQTAVHLALFALAAFTLPVAASESYAPLAPGGSPSLWLLGLLAVSIGPVFFVTAAQAPLMQAWFARTDDPAAGDPYFLYAASNVGSFAALIAYPLLVEPSLALTGQSVLWSLGFAALIALVTLCGMAVGRSGDRPAASRSIATSTDNRPITWPRRIRWILLAAVPSGLLLSTTTHLTTDVMAMPLLWVIPLGVYLASFIVVFGAGPVARAITRAATTAAPWTLLILGSLVFLTSLGFALFYALAGIVLLFVVAVALHGALAADRPGPERLTEFYLWLSVGGALGGLFCALVAPTVFDWTYEHPLLLVAAMLLLPSRPLTRRIGALQQGRLAPLFKFGLPVLAAAVATFVAPHIFAAADQEWVQAGIVLLALWAVLSVGLPLQSAATYATLLFALGGLYQLQITRAPDARVRSFFGIYTVQDDVGDGLRKLTHGTTLHGVQSLVPELRRLPMSYYAPGSGVGMAFVAAPKLFGPNARMGVVGLGTGTLACYARPGQRWTIFEIDPVIERIARDPGLFRYLSDCAPQAKVVIGDARLSLRDMAPGSLDMLAVDAFSSDAIPLHLMTREAFAIYKRALSPDGVLLVHVSNRYLELSPVVAAIARDAGWTARERIYRAPKERVRGVDNTSSDWIVLTRTPQRMAEVEAATDPELGRWAPLPVDPSVRAWTDDHASILPTIKWPSPKWPF